MRGMMLHQEGSTHEWVGGRHWDLIITLDDATSEHYSMFFVEEEGTASSCRALVEVIEGWGLPSSLYTDRGSHYWHTPEADRSAAAPKAPRSVPSSGTTDALRFWDDNGNGRITCREARSHGIAPVSRGHPAYPFMRDGDGVVCE